MPTPLFLFVAVLILVSSSALAEMTVPGPINARVVSIYDGDTLTVDAEPWPRILIRTSVRIDGVDTPEIRGKCEKERELAIAAREFVRARIGEKVQLTNVRLGKFAGRVIADIHVGEERLADLLVAEGLGRPYDGGSRESWCD